MCLFLLVFVCSYVPMSLKQTTHKKNTQVREKENVDFYWLLTHTHTVCASISHMECNITVTVGNKTVELYRTVKKNLHFYLDLLFQSHILFISWYNISLRDILCSCNAHKPKLSVCVCFFNRRTFLCSIIQIPFISLLLFYVFYTFTVWLLPSSAYLANDLAA